MKTDKEKHGLRGPVKNVLVETAQFEELTEKPWFSHSYSFNKDGQLIEQVNRNPDGSEWRTVFNYSDSGNLLSMRSFDPAGALASEERYLYDAGGEKVKIQELDFPGEANVMMAIEGTNTYVSAAGARRVESRYDDRGEVIEVKVFGIDGALVSRVEITRDEWGNSLEETQYVGDVFPFGPCASDSCSAEGIAALTEEQKAEFTAEIAQLFSPGTAMLKRIHTYDTQGRLIESKLTMMGIDTGTQTFAYDELGNKSEEVSYNESGELASKGILTHEYDEHGNWTKELVSTSSGPAHLTRRVITYW